MVSRWRTTISTSVRASSAVSASPSDSASSRSRMAGAVRCPNSASKTAESAARRAARRLRSRSAADAIDDDGNRPELEAEQPLDRTGDCDPGFATDLGQVCPGTSDDPDTDVDLIVVGPDGDRGPAEEGSPLRPTSGDPENAGDLQRGQARHRDDDPATDGQDGPAHAGASAGAASSASAAAMSAGTPVRAVRAATSHANQIIRRFARPCVMITDPRTPRSGPPPTFS